MRKIGILALVLVFAFGALGVSYAHWSQELYIEQTIQTGVVRIGFAKLITAEMPEYEGKDVGSISGSLSGEIVGYIPNPIPGGPPIPVYSEVVVLVENAYPCYEVWDVVDVANVGTIPVIITSLTLSMKNMDTGEELVWEDWGYLPPGVDLGGDFKNEDGEPVLNLWAYNLVGEQLEPEEVSVLEIHKHLKQAAEQGATYKVTIGITGVQWNLA